MSRVTTILTKARKLLADRDSKRWSDQDLLDELNDGLSNFVLHTKSLKLRTGILLETNIGVYDMSLYSSSIERVQYLTTALKPKLSSQMDKIDYNWQDTIGNIPKYVIFNNYQNSKFRVYPKITDTTTNIITQNSITGGLIDIEISDELIVAPNIVNIDTEVNKFLIVYYIGKPRTLTITSLDTEVDLHPTYDQALVHYIVGQCLLYDQDSMSTELGLKQLSMYESYVDKVKKKESKNNTTYEDYEVEYRRF